jgi:hypothetical protein
MKEDRMHKLIAAVLLLFLFAALQNRAFAYNLDCKLQDSTVSGVKSVKISNDYLIINKNIEIPLEKTKVRCANFGRQTRLDGNALGYQVVLKTCSTEAQLEGHLIDSVNLTVSDVICDKSL